MGRGKKEKEAENSSIFLGGGRGASREVRKKKESVPFRDSPTKG